MSRPLLLLTKGEPSGEAKVLVDFAFLFVLKRVAFELWVQRAIGISLDVAWIAAMVTCWVLARRARRYARTVGIDLTPTPTPEPRADESADPRR